MNKLNKLVMLITIVSFFLGQTGFVFAKVSPAEKRTEKNIENRNPSLPPVSFDAAGRHLFNGKPTIVRIPLDQEGVDQSCGFDVGIRATGIAVSISYTDAEGVFHEFLAAPQLKMVLTRLDTGNSLTVNIAGPGNFTLNPDGSVTIVGTGGWSWFVDPDTLEPGLFLTQGRFVLSIDAEGNRTFTRTGNKTNLCALL